MLLQWKWGERQLKPDVSVSGFLGFSEHARTDFLKQIQSPGFPNVPYPPNTFIEWQLRADPNYVIKLEFDTMNLEENCKNDFVKIYDSLVPIQNRIMDEWVRHSGGKPFVGLIVLPAGKLIGKAQHLCFLSRRMCGYYSPSEPLTFLSSRNVMLVIMATNEKKNYPGFRAQVSQVKRGSQGKNHPPVERTSFYFPWIHNIWSNESIIRFNRHNMWWSADWGKGEVYLPQLPKLLSSSNFMSVDHQGEISEMYYTWISLFCSEYNTVYIFLPTRVKIVSDSPNIKVALYTIAIVCGLNTFGQVSNLWPHAFVSAKPCLFG